MYQTIDYVTSSDELAELMENERIEKLEQENLQMRSYVKRDGTFGVSYECIMEDGMVAYVPYLGSIQIEEMHKNGIPKKNLDLKTSAKGHKYYHYDRWA